MPLLMCPNCNASMQEVKRAEVAFDMCPTCRGIWLDRGELEKLIEGGRAERQDFERERDDFYRDPEGYRRSHQGRRKRDEGEDRDRDIDPRAGRRRRGFDLFYIFD